MRGGGAPAHPMVRQGGAKSGFGPPIISENSLKRGIFGGAESAAGGTSGSFGKSDHVH